VNYKVVRAITHHSKSTCFSVPGGQDMPSAEVLAIYRRITVNQG